MRIAMVSEHASPLAVLGRADAGGQNVHVDALSRQLARLGHEVRVYTRRDDPALPERLPLAPGVEVVHVPAGPATVLPKDDLLPHMTAFGRWLRRDWARGALPDVAHAHFWMSGLATLPAARSLGVPVVQTFHALGSVKRRHQGAQDTSPPGRVRSERGLAQSVDLVLATCRDEVAELARLGLPRSRARVVPCGVDVHHIAAAPVRPVSGGPHRLLCVGRLVERKGVDTVIRALDLLPDAVLRVVGGPPADGLGGDPEVFRLSALARERGVAERVEFAGRVDQERLPAELHAADVVVAVPWYEPFGIVPIEAAAAGRPLVGSAVGGLLDTVVDRRTGLLVPPRDPEALAAALRGLLDDRDLRERMGRAARRRALAEYSWERVALATQLVYEEVIGMPSAATAPSAVLEEVSVG